MYIHGKGYIYIYIDTHKGGTKIYTLVGPPEKTILGSQTEKLLKISIIIRDFLKS